MRPKNGAEAVLPEGWTVHYTHLRRIAVDGTPIDGCWAPHYARKQFAGQGISILPHGGETYAQVFNDDQDPISEGKAICHDADSFSRVRGNSLALSRALKGCGLPKKPRQKKAAA